MGSISGRTELLLEVHTMHAGHHSIFSKHSRTKFTLIWIWDETNKILHLLELSYNYLVTKRKKIAYSCVTISIVTDIRAIAVLWLWRLCLHTSCRRRLGFSLFYKDEPFPRAGETFKSLTLTLTFKNSKERNLTLWNPFKFSLHRSPWPPALPQTSHHKTKWKSPC